mgnify:CR=1 FL=1|jgi:hypothetical protein
MVVHPLERGKETLIEQSLELDEAISPVNISVIFSCYPVVVGILTCLEWDVLCGLSIFVRSE